MAIYTEVGFDGRPTPAGIALVDASGQDILDSGKVPIKITEIGSNISFPITIGGVNTGVSFINGPFIDPSMIVNSFFVNGVGSTSILNKDTDYYYAPAVNRVAYLKSMTVYIRLNEAVEDLTYYQDKNVLSNGITLKVDDGSTELIAFTEGVDKGIQSIGDWILHMNAKLYTNDEAWVNTSSSKQLFLHIDFTQLFGPLLLDGSKGHRLVIRSKANIPVAEQTAKVHGWMRSI